jgi:hypothetical protein
MFGFLFGPCCKFLVWGMLEQGFVFVSVFMSHSDFIWGNMLNSYLCSYFGLSVWTGLVEL